MPRNPRIQENVACRSCGKIVPDSTYLTINSKYCFSCFESGQHRSTDVQSYSYDVTNRYPSHYESNQAINKTVLLGFEMEYEAKEDDSNSLSRSMVLAAYKSKYGIVKSDGSLHSGYEFNSRPMSLRSHRAFAKNLFDNGFVKRAVVKRTCGMHVHISKNQFTATHLGKFLFFFGSEENIKLITTVSGRRYMNNNYCNNDGRGFMPKIDDVCQETKTLKDGNYRFNKYVPVNVKNMTVEVRTFAATTKLPVLMARLEFCEALFQFTKYAPVKRLNARAFMAWLGERSKKYNNLSGYIAYRGYSATEADYRACQIEDCNSESVDEHTTTNECVVHPTLVSALDDALNANRPVSFSDTREAFERRVMDVRGTETRRVTTIAESLLNGDLSVSFV